MRKFFWGVGLAVVCALPVMGQTTGRGVAGFKLEIGKETTPVEGPLLGDGTVDYVKAYETVASAGVTAENNAGAVIQRVLGLPWPEGVAGGPDGASGSKGASEVYEDWLVYGKREWESGAEAEAWKKLKEAKQQGVDRTEVAPWKAEDYPLLARWLAAEEEPLKLLTAGTLRPRYFRPQSVDPATKAPWNHVFPGVPSGLGQVRALAKALQMRAMLRAGSGDVAGAWDDARTIRRLGRLISQEPSTISTIVSSVLDAMSWRVELVLAQGETLSTAQRGQLATEARTTEEFRFPAVAIDIGHRFNGLNFVMGAIRGNPEEVVSMCTGLEYSYLNDTAKRPPLKVGDLSQTDWNIVLRMANRDCDAETAIAGETDEAKVYQRVAALADTHRAGRDAGVALNLFEDFGQGSDRDAKRQKFIEAVETYLLRRPNETQAAYSERIGILLEGDFSGDGKVFRLVLGLRVYQRQLEMVLALRAFHEAKGVYPAKLEELVPGYLDRVPNDSFSGGAMVYRAEGKGYLLYSVGKNARDDGGKDAQEQKDADDIVCRMDH